MTTNTKEKTMTPTRDVGARRRDWLEVASLLFGFYRPGFREWYEGEPACTTTIPFDKMLHDLWWAFEYTLAEYQRAAT
jgi:hypothetical protein